MGIKIFFIITVSLMVQTLPLFAENNNWANQTEFSFVNTSGNTSITNLSAKNTFSYKFNPKITSEFLLSALYGASNGEKNSENYKLEIRTDYSINKTIYLSIISGWSKDIFAGINPEYFIGPALGIKIIENKRNKLCLEAGLEYVNREYTDTTKTDYTYSSGRIFTKYEFSLNSKNKLNQSLEFNYDFKDSDNYDINSISSITSTLSDYFSLKTSYEVKYINAPVPSTLKNTDTILSIALVVNIG